MFGTESCWSSKTLSLSRPAHQCLLEFNVSPKERRQDLVCSHSPLLTQRTRYSQGPFSVSSRVSQTELLCEGGESGG